MKIVLVFLSFLLLQGCRDQPKGDPVLLRLKLKAGDQFVVEMETVTKTNSEDLNINYKTRMHFKVDSVSLNGEQFFLSSKLDLIDMRSKGGRRLGNDDYYSGMDEAKMNEEQKQMHAEFKPMLDSILYLTMNNRGEVTKSFTFSSGQQVSEDAPPIDLSNVQIIFPVKPVQVDEHWSNEKTNSLVKIKTVSDYHIQSVGDSLIEINVKAKMDAMPGLGRDNNMHGYYKINRVNNRLSSAKLEMDIAMYPAGEGKLSIFISSY